MPIQLSEQAERLAQAEAERGGFADAGEYVESLIERDRIERVRYDVNVDRLRKSLNQADQGELRPAREAMLAIAEKLGIAVPSD